ncbi:MAG: ribosome biogenesis factor YjgA [Steroidobacteraceae bacterium]|nr:DUF615 domain-containing protein [Nevskiaceae bacterium]MCP5339470.1 DUF615 domain-containing protein [Nevskiaceae bacterium]MCP5467599.1 DUF615 domain-containing protein [Nevskiaceae bacterium]
MIRDRRFPRDDADCFDRSDEPPSKSARKRAAHAAQDLGERLIGLREAELLALPLPESLLEAIQLARRITARGGLTRQRQYIGKLMREIDPAPIESALAARAGVGAREAALFRSLEHWRTRLLDGGDAALTELCVAHPGLDRQRLAAPLTRARAARDDGERARTARALFRELRRQFLALEPTGGEASASEPSPDLGEP